MLSTLRSKRRFGGSFDSIRHLSTNHCFRRGSHRRLRLRTGKNLFCTDFSNSTSKLAAFSFFAVPKTGWRNEDVLGGKTAKNCYFLRRFLSTVLERETTVDRIDGTAELQ